MLKALRNSRKDNEGFSLVELLVVLLIMSIIAGIAVPLYLNQKQRSYLSLAQADATAIGQEMTSILADYTTFGTATCTTNLCPLTLTSGSAIAFTAMTAAAGSGTAAAAGPGTTTSTIRLSPGSTATGNTGSGATMPWCIIVTNNSTYAKYVGSATGTSGLVLSQIGGTAPTCSAGA